MPEETTPPVISEVVRTTNPKNNLGIPIAIVCAAALIAGAIYLSGAKNDTPVNVQGGIDSAQNNNQVTPEVVVAPVTSTDHILGNPNADILIVEYSDFDCPFCKSFHETMTKIMKDYGPNGKVAWVYRHFPLEQLHLNAPKLAAASECVAELGGNDAFWKFGDLIFGGREINAKTDLAKLPEYAVSAGVDKGQFELCFNSGKYDEAIKEAGAAALKTGARGTPYSIVMVGDQQGVINGAQPYDVVKQMIGNIITQIQGGVPVAAPTAAE